MFPTHLWISPTYRCRAVYSFAWSWKPVWSIWTQKDLKIFWCKKKHTKTMALWWVLWNFLHVKIRIRTSYVLIWRWSIHAIEVEEKFASVNTFSHWNLLEAKMSRRQNVSTSKSLAPKCQRQTVSAPKHLVAKTSQRQYLSAQKVAWQEVFTA